MTVLDTLTLALGIDSKGIDTGLAEAQRKIDQGARSLANSLMSPFKAAIGSLIAGFSLAAITRQYLQQADAIGKLSDSIGADMEDLQAWGEAAKRAGGSAEAFQGTVQSLTRNLQKAATNAKGPAAQALTELGIKATDATGKARDSFEVLRDLAGVMEGMDKQKAVALGQKVGIDRGTIMLLQSGRAAVDDLIAREKELGGYTKEDAEIAAKANRAIADLGQALKAASADIMRYIAPAITWVTEHLTALVKDFRQHKAFYLSAIGAISALLGAKLIPQLLKISGIAKYINVPFAILSTIITGLALVFEDLWVYMNGGKSAFEDWWKELGTGPELLDKFNKAWENTKKTVDNVLKAVQKLYWDTIAYLVSKFDYFYEIFGGLWDIIEGLFNFDFEQIGKGLGRAFTGAWKLIESVFNDIFKGMGKMSVWDAVENGAKKAWDAVLKLAKGFFNALPPEAQAKLKETWEHFKNFVHWEEIKDKFKWDEIKTTAINAWNGIQSIAQTVIDFVCKQIKFITDNWQIVETGAKGVWNTIKTVSKTVFDFIQKKIKYVVDHWDEIKTTAVNAWNEIKRIAKEVLEYLSSKFEYVSNIVDGIWTAINGLFNFDFKQLGEGLGKAFNSAYQLIKSIFDDIFGWFDNISASSDSVWDTVVNVAKSAWDSLTEFAKGFFSQLDPELQKAIQAVGVFAGAWAIEKTVSGIIGIGKEVSGLTKLVSGLFNIIKAHPLGLILTAIGLIIVYWDDIVEAVQGFFKWLNEKWEWFKGLFDAVGVKLSEAEKAQQEQNALVTDASNYGAEHFSDPAGVIAAATKLRPSDAVSSQAAAAITNESTTNNVTQDDNRTFNFHFTGVTDDPDGFFKMVKGPLFKNPGWMSQSASTMQFGGAS